ncbi:MAG: IS110 family transposase [Candidatus Polarisedimenticolia bacterium]
MNRVFGLDIHKHFAEVAVLEPGAPRPSRLRFPATADGVRAFAAKLGPEDRVALESCTNAFAFHRLLSEHAGQVVVSNPLKTRVIAEAKVKTDKVDAEILARLLAADFLPPVWVPDVATDALRHLVLHRHGLVQQRTQAKNRIHAILHRNLIAPEFTDLFGKGGRQWLGAVELPAEERRLLEADLRLIDFLNSEVATAEQQLARTASEDPEVLRLLTIPGISTTSAVALKAAIGDVKRFRSPHHLVSYFGLNPAVYQSGQKAYTGHISRRGRSHARSVCVEAAHMLVRTPGPFRAFFHRLARRKPHNVAITAVARKLTVLVWHMLTSEEDYHYSPPSSTRRKIAQIRRLTTGRRARRGELPGPALDRTHDRDIGNRGEADYEEFIRGRFGPQGPPGVEHPNRKPRNITQRKKSRSSSKTT